MQSTSIQIQSSNGSLSIAAVYCPPRFSISEGQFMDFYNSLGDRFIAAGDYNAKHTHWGSRLVTPKGRQFTCHRGNVLAANVFSINANILATGAPTYYSSAVNRRPSCLDFSIYRNIPHNKLNIRDSWDLESDHLSLITTLKTEATQYSQRRQLLGKHTNVAVFKEELCRTTHLNIDLNSAADIDEAVDLFSTNVKNAAMRA
ncbi:hypothetical protein KR018_009278, partial [Drosophila ironensis]